MTTEITSTCTTCHFNDGSDWGRGWCARCTNRDSAPCFAPPVPIPTVEAPNRDPGWEAVAYYEALCKERDMAEHLYEVYNRHGSQLRAIMDELDRVQQSFY